MTKIFGDPNTKRGVNPDLKTIFDIWLFYNDNCPTLSDPNDMLTLHFIMFISEKTFKTIACSHPFIVMGNKNTMSKLREMGYKTFDNFIDEGYDPLPTHERLQRIIKTLYHR